MLASRGLAVIEMKRHQNRGQLIIRMLQDARMIFCQYSPFLAALGEVMSKPRPSSRVVLFVLEVCDSQPFSRMLTSSNEAAIEQELSGSSDDLALAETLVQWTSRVYALAGSRLAGKQPAVARSYVSQNLVDANQLYAPGSHT